MEGGEGEAADAEQQVLRCLSKPVSRYPRSRGRVIYLMTRRGALRRNGINKPKVSVQFVALFRLWQNLLFDLPRRRAGRRSQRPRLQVFWLALQT